MSKATRMTVGNFRDAVIKELEARNFIGADRLLQAHELEWHQIIRRTFESGVRPTPFPVRTWYKFDPLMIKQIEEIFDSCQKGNYTLGMRERPNGNPLDERQFMKDMERAMENDWEISEGQQYALKKIHERACKTSMWTQLDMLQGPDDEGGSPPSRWDDIPVGDSKDYGVNL